MLASMIVGRSGAKGHGYQAESISSYYQGVGLPSKQICTVDATTMQVRRVVNGQVVPPFAEGATLP